MKNFVCVILILAAAFSISAADVKPEPARAIRLTPAAPKFSDAERIAELERRRAFIAGKMNPNSMLVLMSAEPRLYSNDVDYVYRQENNLYYLTMLKKSDATLVLLPGTATPEILFLAQRDPRAAAYEGKLYSPAEATRISGVKTVLDAKEFPQFLAAIKSKQPFKSPTGITIQTQPENLYLVLPESQYDRDGQREYNQEFEFAQTFANAVFDQQNGRYNYQPTANVKIQLANQFFAEARLVKSAFEQKIMQHAVDITTEAFGRSMAVAGRSKFEYEVQAEVEYTFRRRNADFWGYPSIVGCGPNATTLHYNESQGEILPNSLLLMDVGAEYDHYTADVTRTFPINGKFSKEQAEIYQIVFDAQEAVTRATKPGATFDQVNRAAREVQSKGLFKLGLIPDEKSAFAQIWTLHGTSHWLGMNVHDAGAYNAKFKPGMIFTNEPGVYIREDALDNLPNTPEAEKFKQFVRPAFEKYKNIGVRIEDDLLVTEAGADYMTRNLPRTISEIEAMIARAKQELPPSATATNVEQKQPILFDFNQNLFLQSPIFASLNGKSFVNGKTVRGGFAFVGTAKNYENFAAHKHD